MALLDFLTGSERINPAQTDAQGLLQPPTVEQQPGLLDRASKPGDDGVNFWDKVYAAGAIMGGDSSGGLQYLDGKRSAHTKKQIDAQKVAERQRKNEAFMKAYVPDGKGGKRFDPAAYMEAVLQFGGDGEGGGTPPDIDIMGDMGEALEFAGKQRPKTRIMTTREGLVRVNEDTGDYEMLEEFDQPAPSGYRWKEDNSGLELIPGYAEGVDRISGIRREAVTSRPMPKQGGGGKAPNPALQGIEAVLKKRGLL